MCPGQDRWQGEGEEASVRQQEERGAEGQEQR